MKVLYFGDTFQHSTSAHRADSLRRLGHEVTHIDPRAALPRTKLVAAFAVRFGFSFFRGFVERYVKKSIPGENFDIAWVNCCPELPPSVYTLLRSRGMRVVNYNNDDPFGGRDGRKWSCYVRSLSLQDLTVVVRDVNVAEAYARGAKKVLRVFMSYDPVAHAPIDASSFDKSAWASEVSFIGTWMPERGPFLVDLVKQGVPLTIRGSRWPNAPEWEFLKPYWRGKEVHGKDYVAAIQGSKVCVGLLSKGNRDLHTQRSLEVPYIRGGVLCAERTTEHLSMYKDGEDVLMWSDAKECATLCKHALESEGFRRELVMNAHNKLMRLRLSNDDVVADILAKLA
jgi:hypothetical protein